mgnify:CR=1 FL=1
MGPKRVLFSNPSVSGGADGLREFPGECTPIFFSSCRKENGSCAAQKKRRFDEDAAHPGRIFVERGPCESVRQASEAPSTLRPIPVVEIPGPRIDRAVGRRGACRI